jgi:hypothetical protein
MSSLLAIQSVIFDLALLRFGKRYSQKIVYFHRNNINGLMYLALYLKNEINTAQFGVLWGLNTCTTALSLQDTTEKNSAVCKNPAPKRTSNIHKFRLTYTTSCHSIQLYTLTTAAAEDSK